MKKSKINNVPRFARWILKRFLNRLEHETLIGDLDEMFNINALEVHRSRAHLWYWIQIAKVIPVYFINSIYIGATMLKNYIKIALRHLKKNKAYSIINIFGLSVGMACCLLMMLFVQDELSYDKFHENADRIFRIVASTSGDNIPTNANGIYGTGPALERYFTEVADYVRIKKMGQGSKIIVGYNEKQFYEDKFFFADPGIFTIFNFPLLKGDPETALTSPNTIVLTEETAKKYFGIDDPIGKTLTADPYNTGDKMEFQVTGVAQNVPGNSHVHFDFLASYISQRGDLTTLSGFEQNFTYVLLDDKASAESVDSRLLDFLHDVWSQDPWYTNHLQPLLDIHLRSHFRSEIEANGNIAFVYIFSAVAFFILIVACINFMNLSTARSAKRAKEVGLRKVAGAQRAQLVRQFFGESIILSVISGGMSLLLLVLFLPVFNAIADKNVTLDLIQNPLVIGGLFSIVLIVGIISGTYPALLLSAFKPINVLKGNTLPGLSGMTVRKGLVLFQFVVSITMIAATGIVLDQLQFIKSKNLGYDRDQVVVVSLNEEVRGNYDALKGELLKNPHILKTSTSSLVPTKGSSHNSYTVDGLENELSLARYFIDEDFLETYGIPIVAGRNATRNVLEESGGDFLISESAINYAGWASPEDALGRGIERGEVKGQIVGVVNDLNIYSLRENLYSLVFFVTPIQYHNFLSIRLDPENISESLEYITSTWKDVNPGVPLDYFFLDESFEKMHYSDLKLSSVFTYFSSLAILIACLGLFGLAAFTSEQRIKEIGIRKVLGASVKSLLFLLSKDFLKLVLIANLIAIPISYIAMNRWLDDFAYKTGFGIETYITAVFLSVGIAFITILFHTTKSAYTNPVDVLKHE